MTEHKSERIRQVALANGWKCEIQTNMDQFEKSGNLQDIHWHLYAKRDSQTIHIVYVGNRLEGGLYKYGDRSIKLWWKYEVIKVLTEKPDPAKYRKKSDDDTVDRAVPWDNDSPAMDIMLAVIRKEVKWVRKLDGSVCTAVVDVNLKEKGSAKYFRISEGKNGRVLEWADAMGFHAVALDQIISVS